MPLETGEKRIDSDDDDPEIIGGDHEDSRDRSHEEAEPTVESSLGEFEETLNKRQHDSGEATGEPSLDPVDEGYPRERAVAAHEESGEGSLLEWSLGEYEATLPPLASGSEATSETGEDGARIIEHDQLTDSESGNVRSVGIHAGSGEVAGTEMSTDENQLYSRQNEGEVNEERTESSVRSDEYFPVRLSEFPDAFVGENTERLVGLGLLPEKDEAKLDDDTVLRFDLGEGLTLTHENHDYEITSVEHDVIGDMDLYRYVSGHGEEFLHIPDQGKLVPPTEMTWYAYPPNTEVYLDREYKHELFEAAVDKAGGIAALRQELEQHGTEINAMFVYKHLHDLRDGISEDKLIPILNYLGRDLDEVNVHITAIGHTGAVEHPNLPFHLSEKHGTRLLAARDGDGTLSASEGRGPRFSYANKEAEMRDRIVESLSNVFGGANILNREYDNREVAKVRTSSDIIGYALQRAGAAVGEIVDQNPHVPTHIMQGSMENKHEWLVQSFGDEGFAWANRGKVCIGRSVELSSVLSEHMSRRLDQMDWGSRYIGGVFVDDIRSYDDLPADIRQAIREHSLNLLVEEKEMLEDFGVVTELYPSEIHRGKYGDYSAHWTLQTKTREDTRRFYEEIGFPQERKQEDLRLAIRFER